MAPQNKRAAAVAKVPVMAKKAKTVAVSEPEDPLALQLHPIISALESSDLPADCCEILRSALPLSLAEAADERHGFQNQMLDLAATSLKGLEVAARASLTEAEARAGDLRAQGAVANADFEAAKRLATAKQEECDANSTQVERLRGEEDAAKAKLAEAVEAKDAFQAVKTQLSVDQEEFQKVLDEMWQPLKAASFTGGAWRKRDKVIHELMEKCKPLGLDESLMAGLLAALKLKLDHRTVFAQRALDYAEERFQKHTVSLAEKVAGTASEEEAREKTVIETQARVADIHAKFSEQDKEFDELQNNWAELETTSNKAQSAAVALETDVQAALADVVARQADLDAALGLAASFVLLRDPPPQEQPAAEESSEVAVEPAITMETEVPEMVAVA